MAKSTLGKVRRDEILLKARTVLGQVGYDKFSIKAVAERLNCPNSVIHYHFKTKTILFEEIILSVQSS